MRDALSSPFGILSAVQRRRGFGEASGEWSVEHVAAATWHTTQEQQSCCPAC